MHCCQLQPRVNHISGSISTGNFSVYSMAGLRSEKIHNPGKIAVRKDTQSNRNNRMVLQKWNRKSTSEVYAFAHVCRTSLVTFKQHALEHVVNPLWGMLRHHAMNYGCGTQPVLTREFCQEKKRISMRTCSSMEFKTTIRLHKLSGFGKPRVLCVNPGYLSKPYKNFAFGFVRYIYIYIYLSLSICLSVYLSIYLSMSLPIYFSICFGV